ncbi:MAG TPA: glycosyltransferase, partial [Ignavibacteriales bacterium]|nr:glycosyltransferase [Ignavibacteriales bacterium]
RQPSLEKMLIEPASLWPEGKFIIAGPMYPDNLNLPSNIETIIHLSPQRHNEFYNTQRFTLNITRTDMKALGYSPSVRLFEAAACGVPIISDYWEGLDSIFEIGKDILVSNSVQNTLNILRNTEEEERKQIGENGMKRILAGHTSEKRAEEFELYVSEVLSERVV